MKTFWWFLNLTRVILDKLLRSPRAKIKFRELQTFANRPIKKFSRNFRGRGKFSDFHANFDYFIFYQYFTSDLKIKIMRVGINFREWQ